MKSWLIKDDSLVLESAELSLPITCYLPSTLKPKMFVKENGKSFVSVNVSNGLSVDLKTSEGLLPGFPPTIMNSKSLPAVTKMYFNSEFHICIIFSK